MNLERELQSALTRARPGEGFAERVMARKTAARPPHFKTWLRIAASIALFALLGGGYTAHHARQQLMLALHIASSKVHIAQREVLKGTP